MRGPDEKQDAIFSYISPEERVPTDHPLRKIRTLVDEVLGDMSRQFARLYADTGRPSIRAGAAAASAFVAGFRLHPE